jgi:hypothetical protein
MQSFRTELVVPASTARISLSDSILTLGSCFSDAIGAYFLSNKIAVKINPFGTVYNPHSIHKVIQYALANQPIPENSFLKRSDIFLNYDFHSEFASASLSDLKKELEGIISDIHHFLRKSDWLIITYGTAWVYEMHETHEVVANCHKMPQNLFVKSLMTQKKILDSFETVYHLLKTFNPNIKIILTVSPVRHLKETIELNSVSKSVLRVACHTLTEQHSDVHYFPSYEIVMDDLRDYRFYKSDMIHPSEDAEQYIWEKFADHFFDEKLKSFLIKWSEIKTALAHKPFHPESSAHQNFLQQTLKKLIELKALVNVDQEMATLEQQLRSADKT